MSQLTDRLERDLREIAADADPSPSAWASIASRLGEDVEPELLALPPIANRSSRRAWITAAAAAFVVLAGAIAVLTRAADDDPPATVDQVPTATFVSPRNGFSFDYPAGGEVTVTPSVDLWNMGFQSGRGVDVVDTGSGARFTGASTETPDEVTSIDDIDDLEFDWDYWPEACSPPRNQEEEITIDGQPARLASCPDDIVASVVDGRHLYQFTLQHGPGDAREVFDAFVATIRLTPETAVDFPNVVDGPHATTFVSPTNGYAFGVVDRGGLVAATEPWAPSPGNNDPVTVVPAGFDFNETGYAAGFLGASTEIPAGVPIDEWVDGVAVKRGLESLDCLVPRRERQEEITIDGRSGRLLQCPNELTATVIAGGRFYQFGLWHGGRDDARAWFDEFLTTIDLRPEDAAPAT